MNNYQLMQFIEIAEQQNITKAAKNLFMSQSSLSNTLKLLEDELGCMLFDRVGNKIIINENGNCLLRYARQVTALMESAENEIRSMNNRKGHTIKISSEWPKYFQLLSKYFYGLNEFVPKIQMDIIPRSVIFKKLVSGECDVAITSDYPLPNEDVSCLEKLMLLREEIFISVPKDHPLSISQKAFLKDFGNEMFLGSPNSPIADWKKVLCDQANISIKYESILDVSVSGSIRRDSKLVSFVTSTALWLHEAAFLKEKRSLIKLKDKNTVRNVYLWHLKDCSKKVMNFIEKIKYDILK